MSRIPSHVRALILLLAAWASFRFGAAPLTALLTGTAAPLPRSLVLLYTLLTASAILVYLSVHEEHWRELTRLLAAALREPTSPTRSQRARRIAVLALLPVVAGVSAWRQAAGQGEPPADPPGIHFDLPGAYVGLRNPLEWSEDNIRNGGILYTRHCAPCHGDALDGRGPAARAWQPAPANFRDTGTIAQLDENYLFWRIKEGGPGLPSGAIGYRSAMPVWQRVLSEEEIWQIIMFEYTNAGTNPAKR